MRRSFLVLILIGALLGSCKAPLPVYFDKPVGEALDTFPGSMQGNFYFVEEILDRGLNDFQKVYEIKNNKIVLVKDSVQEVSPKENNEVKQEPENEFYKIAALNQLALSHIDSAADVIEKEKKIAFAFIRITESQVNLIIRDSLGGDHEVEMLRLGPDLRLSVSLEEHYLNIRTPYGWEYMKVEEWNKGEFLNFIPFYFTSYDDRTGSESVFLKSTAHIYPGMKPIYNDKKLIVGLKAKSDAKKVKAAFKDSESNFELIRVR